MTKLTDNGERAIRLLDDADDDDDPKMKWTEREPYRRRVLSLLSALRGAREVSAFRALRAADRRARLGLLEHFAPSKRRRGERHHKPNLLDYAVDDVRRLRDTLQSDDKVTAELIAAERHRRFLNRCCTVDKLGDLEEGEAELRELAEKLHKRLRGRGSTGGERYRARRAK